VGGGYNHRCFIAILELVVETAWLGTRAMKDACELTKAFLILHFLMSVEKMLHIEKRQNKSYQLFNSSMFVVLYAL